MAAVTGLRRAGAFALAALAALLPITLAGSNAAWGLALACALALRFVERKPLVPSGLEIPFLAYLAWEILTAALSDRPGHSLGKVQSEILAAVFLLAYRGQDAPAARRNLALFCASAAVAATLGLMQRAMGFSYNDYLATGARPTWGEALAAPVLRLFSEWTGRAVGFYSHPITYAEMLLLAVLPALGLALARGRRWWTLTALLFGGIAASGTRGVWLALAASLFLWAVSRRDKRLWGALAALGVAVAAVAAASPEIRARAAGLLRPGAVASDSLRPELWRKSLDVVKSRPVFGVGIGNLHLTLESSARAGYPPDADWTETHNAYLQMAVERGLPGLALFLWLLVLYGRLFRDVAKISPEHEGMFFGFLGLCLAGLTESWTHDSEVMLCLYFLLGTAAALKRPATLAQSSRAVGCKSR